MGATSFSRSPIPAAALPKINYRKSSIATGSRPARTGKGLVSDSPLQKALSRDTAARSGWRAKLARAHASNSVCRLREAPGFTPADIADGDPKKDLSECNRILLTE